MYTINKVNTDLSNPVSEVPQILRDSYLPSLDGLRAISILMVVGAHLGMAYKSYDHYLHPIANLGVQFFFVISGFLITTILTKEKIAVGTISLKKFYIRRFFRIIPVAYLYLFLILILNVVLNLKMDYFSILLSSLFIRNFWINAKGINNLSAHYWSLSVEEQFYLVFPIILKKNTTYFIIFLALMIVSPIAVDVYSLHYKSSNVDSPIVAIIKQFFTQFQAISVGSICSILLFKKAIQLPDNIHRITLLTLIFLLIIFFLLFNRNSIFSINNMLISFSFAAIIILNLQKSAAKSFEFLNNKYIKYVGVLSYSIYIWQQPFSYSLTFIKKMGFFQPYKDNSLVYIAITFGSVIAILLVSNLSYFFYEKQFLKLKDRFK